MINLVTKQLTMNSTFSELPHDLIIDIIRIDNYRKKYDKVVEQINMVTTYELFCPSIREMMNGADDDDYWDAMSASQIWGWDDMRVMNDLSWLNELWWNEEKKRIQRLRYEEVIKQLNEYPDLDWRTRLRVLKKMRELWGIDDAAAFVR